ncbi:hypothetical protein SS50377_23688 [Spironucleus salmonicida]|uniref:Uncharacterized protein n=1 Tax=Spironucleus salmonicida TaxID=348837 RepID=V6LVT1_9EUKA|nr:hypothetical protein SS50377_23688 [Spironucleus salmonicida]|eukprot:EST48670.1 Hypothetical protein SS50377_11283 [Spironucleus salmonicida]
MHIETITSKNASQHVIIGNNRENPVKVDSNTKLFQFGSIDPESNTQQKDPKLLCQKNAKQDYRKVQNFGIGKWDKMAIRAETRDITPVQILDRSAVFSIMKGIEDMSINISIITRNAQDIGGCTTGLLCLLQNYNQG